MLRRACLRWIALPLLAAGPMSLTWAGSYDDFFTAANNDNLRLMQSVLQKGFDVNSRSPDGQHALYLALRNDSTEVTELLLAHPALEVDARNAVQETPLMMAAIKGNLPAMRKLLQRGAAVHFPGWSPIHYAATAPEHGPEAVQLLLDRGAPIEAPSENGTTPLMMAARYGTEDTVKLLVRRGADKAKRNDRGMNAADFAASADRDNLAPKLAPDARWP